MLSHRSPVKRARIRAAVVSAAVLCALVVPTVPVHAERVPEVLAASRAVGAAAVAPGFAIEYLGVTWKGPHGTAHARLRTQSGWSRWIELEEDGAQRPGEFGTALLAAGDATAYQVRVPGAARQARAVAINVSDGPRTVVAAAAGAEAATTVVSRAGWGADESLRYSGGVETWPPAYYGLQKLTVHHTATANGDTDPAGTVRAIYRYHAIDRGWGDIGYQYVVDEAGVVYEGRWSGTDGDPAHDASGNVVTAAHVAGYNSGNVGVALLGTLTDVNPAPAAQSSLESVLADLSGRHDIDPRGSGSYVNPVNGATKTVANISGHRDWEPTECPGGALYSRLPQIRDNVANRLQPPPQALTLSARGYKVKSLQKAELTWSGATLVDIYRDGRLLVAGASGSRYIDHINRKGGGTYRYVVKSGTTTSNEAVVTF